MFRRLILTFIFASVIAPLATAEELTKAKTSDIKRLIEITGSTNIAKQFAAATSRQMFQMLQASNSEIPERALPIMEKELVALLSAKMVAPGGLVEKVVPVYHKYFTHKEIQELLAFYASPVGKKTIQVLPSVINESMMLGQQWGQSLGPEIGQRVQAALKREGLLPKGQ